MKNLKLLGGSARGLLTEVRAEMERRLTMACAPPDSCVRRGAELPGVER